MQKQPYFDAFNDLQTLKKAKCQPPYSCTPTIKLYIQQILPEFRKKYPNKQEKDLESLIAKQWESMTRSEHRPHNQQKRSLMMRKQKHIGYMLRN